jgi:NAD+ kinase
MATPPHATAPSKSLCPATKNPRVVLLGSGESAVVEAEVKRLRPLIEQQVDVVLCDLEFRDGLEKVDADLVIVFGGDGSILRAAHRMAYRQLPVIGCNLGRLGFLAAFSASELLTVLPDICSGKYAVVEHLMFECRVLRGGDVLYQKLGLNETAVFGGPPYRMLDIQLYVDSEPVTTYSCDGLIVATPVGSTAHSLSSGGPILRKDLQAFVISPISPHTLTNRPVVDSAERVFELTVALPNEGTAVVVDGQLLCPLQSQDRVRIERAAPRFKLVEVAHHSYYRTLREKLGWGGRVRRE